MAVSVFTCCSYFRRFVGISNNVSTLFSGLATQILNTKSRPYTTSTDDEINDIAGSVNKPAKKMSKAMLAYLQRAKEHDEFMNNEIAAYEIGKRHLANMMGEDPNCFTQADVDRAIEYLFPSGLFDPKARPIMKHPKEIFPSRKAAEFDETGRPYHSMFYTSKPNYNETLYNVVDKMKSLDNIEDSLIRQGISPGSSDKINLVGSAWLSKMEIDNLLLENTSDVEYEYLIKSLERLSEHPLSKREENFIMKHRKALVTHVNEIIIPPLEHDSTGRPYITVKNCMRKSARGEVTIWGNGSGKFTINGHDIRYFKDIHHREQVS